MSNTDLLFRLQEEPIGVKPARDHMIVTTMLSGYADLVTKLGGNPSELLVFAGLDESALDDVPGQIRFEAFERLMLVSAVLLDCPDFGLRLAEPKDGPETIQPLDLLIRNAPSLQDVFHYCASRSHLSCSAVRLTMIDHPDRDLKGWRYDFDGYCGSAASRISEFYLSLTRRGMMNLTGGKVRPREIWLAHAPLPGEAHYERAFGAPVRFCAEGDVIFYDPRDMHRSVQGHKRELFEQEASQVRAVFPPRQEDVHTRIRHAIRDRIATGLCEREHIAAALDLSIRTMNRRLGEIGHSFSTLRDEVRKQLALRFLAAPSLSLSDVAERLGLAGAAVLCRMCRRWFDATPQTLRQRMIVPTA